MGRFPKKEEEARGSLKWIRYLINDCPELVNEPLRKYCSLSADTMMSWVSPIREDNYAEYRDQDFLERLGIQLTQRPLKTFWPNFGPQWDALGYSDSGEIFLVEAKAHVSELLSGGTKASGCSKELIENSLKEVQSSLKIRPLIDWSQGLYQYANRLAHLYLLRELNGLPAFLVFVYFVGDEEMGGPTNAGEWKSAIQLAEGLLGFRESNKLRKYVIDVFININQIEKAMQLKNNTPL